jgi:hypothetical protein
MASLNGLCTPVQVFVVLAVISTIIYLINMFTSVHVNDPIDPGSYLFKNNAVQYGYMALLLKVIFYVIFGYLLQVLCKNKLDKVAWVILFLPFVLFGFITIFAMSMSALAVVRGKTGLLAGGFKVGGRAGFGDVFRDQRAPVATSTPDIVNIDVREGPARGRSGFGNVVHSNNVVAQPQMPDSMSIREIGQEAYWAVHPGN